MAPSAVLAVLGAVLLGAYLLEALFLRTHVPDVLFLIAAGLIFGHAFGWGQRTGLESADRLFTEAAVVVILFHGGTSLDLRALARGLGSSVLLTFATFATSLGLTMLLVHVAFGQSWMASAMLGAMLGGTAPTVIVPMVRALKMSDRMAAVLTVEAGLSDVLCIVVCLALISAVQLGHVGIGATAGDAALKLLAAIALGGVCAVGWAALRGLLERHMRKDHLGTVAILFGLVGLAEFLDLSGAMASLCFGLVLGNLHAIPGARRLVPAGDAALASEERYFIHELAFLLKTFFFLYVGLILRFSAFLPMLCAAVLVLLFHGVRPFIARMSLPRATLREEAAATAALVPKGTAAVVLSRIPVQLGLPGAQFLANVAMMAVLFSIVSAAILIFTLRHVDAGRLFGRLFARYAADAPREVSATVAEVASGAS